MKNIWTKGTRGIKELHDTKQSLVRIPTNEDWAMIVDITGVTAKSDGLFVEGEKIWDEAGTKKTFYALANRDFIFQEGGQAIFYRVGEGNNDATDSTFQLRDISNTTKTSFLAVPYENMVFVEDIGGTPRQGKSVDFDSSGVKFVPANSITQNLVTIEPTGNFHNGNPPYKTGRIYAGQRIGNIFLVWLTGFGDVDNEETTVVDSVSLLWQYDNAGKLISMAKVITYTQDDDFIFTGYNYLGPNTSFAQSAGDASTDLVTEGTTSDYEVYTRLWTYSTSPFVDGAQSLSLAAFDSYDESTNAYSTPGIVTEGYEFGGWFQSPNNFAASPPATGTKYSWAKKLSPGCGIPDKDSYYPDYDVYLEPTTKKLQWQEIGPDPQVSGTATSGTTTTLTHSGRNFFVYGLASGDTITLASPSHTATISSFSDDTITFSPAASSAVDSSTTYSIATKNRSSINWENGGGTDSLDADPYPRWYLHLKINRVTYDAATDSIGSSGTTAYKEMAMDCGDYRQVGSTADTPGAHSGFNEEASRSIWVLKIPGGGSDYAIPGWDGLEGFFYNEDIYYTTPGAYDRGFYGGRAYCSRQKSGGWYAYDTTAGEFVSILDHPDYEIDGTSVNGSYISQFADEWKSVRISNELATTIVLLEE